MSKERENYFKRYIPEDVLRRIEANPKDMGEVLSWSTDVSHMHWHVLDMLLHFRHFERGSFEQQKYVDRMDYDDLAKYPKWKTPWWGVMDLSTSDAIERAIRLHDTGMHFVNKGILKPEEHHLGSLYIALQVDKDPRVWEAVYQHVSDVLPPDASDVSRYVRDLDRIVGSGYIGLIRLATYYGFKHPMLDEMDEEKVIKDGVLMGITDRFRSPNEDKARDFFWQNVYPFFGERGIAWTYRLEALSRILLDRLVGRDYTKLGRKLKNEEALVLAVDKGGARVVEPILPRLESTFSYKRKHLLEVLIKNRGGDLGGIYQALLYLDPHEVGKYVWLRPE